jgi:diguanylate cyclase (GGDEF)-like protein/PAS domain S-box-containing protein
MPDRAVVAERARIALAMTSDAVFFLDPDWRFTYLNSAAETLLERTAEDLIGRCVWDEFPEAMGSPIEEEYRRAAASGEPSVLEAFYEPLDRWFDIRAFPDSLGLAVFFRDVTERHRVEEERAEYAGLTDAILNALPPPTAVLDRAGTIVRANQAWQALAVERGECGDMLKVGDNYIGAWEAAERLGHTHAETVLTGLREVIDGTRQRFTCDYEWFPDHDATWFHLQASPMAGRRGMVVTQTDITDRVRSEQAAARAARHDHLTNLPNRARLHEVITEALNGPMRREVTLLFLDLDGFKSVNDSLGHDVGDQLLKDLALRLAGVTRPGDIVGRLGGDEFVVVALDCDSHAALNIAERIRTVLSEPFDVAGMHLPLSASIGIATSSEAGTHPENLIRDADVAMYSAKNAGRDRHHVFTSDLRERAREQLVVAVGLRQAIRRDELVLHYQPVHDLRTGEVDGVEALMRWRHPDLGLLLPGMFIPLADETGLLIPMGRWLLGEAARQVARWAAEGLRLTISVNISAAHLQTGTLVDDVSEALAVAGAPPSQLIIELTEASVAKDLAGATEQLHALRALDVGIAIDDFGAGYSSLGQLTSLPADIIKIDRALLPGADGNDHDGGIRAVVRAVTFVAESLGLLTVAEGVETDDQLQTVTDLGCDMAQGYLFGRPVPAGDVPGQVLPVAERRAGSANAGRR